MLGSQWRRDASEHREINRWGNALDRHMNALEEGTGQSQQQQANTVRLGQQLEGKRATEVVRRFFGGAADQQIARKLEAWELQGCRRMEQKIDQRMQCGFVGEESL